MESLVIAMKATLKALFHEMETVAVHGDMNTSVERLVTDSRRVVPGAAFFAIRGRHSDGNRYIDEALGRGACAVISDQPYARSFGGVAHIQVPEARRALARVAARFFKHPDEVLELIGITGTNGKTTVSSLTQFLLQEREGEVGMLGTVRYDLGGRTLPAYRTTPESVDVYAMLDQMREAGCGACVMEVSSHALDQCRVEGVHFNCVAFLNLTQDHMDYHGEMETYFQIKKQLFTGHCGHLSDSVVINIDDPFGARLLGEISADRRLVTFGFNSEALVRAVNVELGQEGSVFEVQWPEGRGRVSTGLPGNYNVSNVLAALAIAYAQGRSLEDLLPKVERFSGVPGRMEKVQEGQPFQVLVDYAHTDDALRNALSMLRPITPGRLLVVFGCGGDRDRSKRPKMVQAVQRFADYAWATADNPRKEPLEQIFDDMKRGIQNVDTITFVEERRSAIGHALDAAGAGDCVLIAGKGHETFQEFADMVAPFDDRQVARDWLRLKSFKENSTF